MEFESNRHNLMTRAEARELRYRSDSRGTIRLLLHLVWLAVAVLLNTAAFSVLAIFATLLQGFVMVTLFAPLHETIHRTAFNDREINNWVGRIIGVLLFLPADYFRCFHFAHHRYTQIPDKDPELAAAKPKNKVEYVIIMSGLHYWMRQFEHFISASMGRVDADFVPAKRVDEIVFEARWHVAIYLLAFVVLPIFGIWFAYWFWLFPLLLGQPFLRMYLLAEHGGLDLTPDMIENTRTVESNFVVRLLMWNMPYHTEHHIYPAVPFYTLPRLHDQIGRHIVNVETGYIQFHRDYWRNLD